MITSPVTSDLGETRESAIMLGFDMDWLNVEAFIFNGDVERGNPVMGSTEEDHIKDYGFAVTATLLRDLTVGASYLSDLADTDAEIAGDIYFHRVPGLAAYAGYHENPRAPDILADLEVEFRDRAAPALELAGAGGGWGEGYYIHYWLYEWLLFCEVARRVEGVDYYTGAPGFFGQRAVASMFETVPGISAYGSRRAVSMGDGGGRTFGGDRDRQLGRQTRLSFQDILRRRRGSEIQPWRTHDFDFRDRWTMARGGCGRRAVGRHSTALRTV